ncbi:QRIC2 protein, partial [Xiphorhynchus elegans]|nr:QRIC2 protein [Xiphorhynchus elegans]
LARSVLQETKSELNRLEEQQEMKNTMLEQLVTDATSQMQEKLGQLEEIVGTVQEEQEMAKAECSNCTFDFRKLLGELLQRCEKLEEDVNSLESRQTTVGKMENIIRERKQQDKELLQRMELRVSKIQGDCEELSFLSGSLQKDCEQKQKDIEVCVSKCSVVSQ